jgi:hypothetical protein
MLVPVRLDYNAISRKAILSGISFKAKLMAYYIRYMTFFNFAPLQLETQLAFFIAPGLFLIT